MEARSTIVDPRMLEIMEKFPESLENGRRIYDIERNASGEVAKRTLVRSFAARTPLGARLAAGETP